MLPAALGSRHNVIKGRTSAQVVAAVGTLVVPSEVDLITGGAPGDQARLINVVLIH